MNKVVLITGASNGIGAEIARVFADDNYNVVINYNNSKEKAETLANEICASGHNAVCIKADVSNYEQVKQMIEQTIEIFGHIDVLINNAGVCSYNILIDEDFTSISNQLNINLLGTILCSQIVSKQMIKQNYGKIINMSSIWGIVGASGETVYSATKGGIIAFTKALSKELAYSGIMVNSIAPGVVNTNMLNHLTDTEKKDLKDQIPLGRFATTKEVAQLALFLASDKSDYITGQTIQIDGGFLS